MADQEDQGPSQADTDAVLAAAQGGGEEDPSPPSDDQGGPSPSKGEADATGAEAQPEPADGGAEGTSSAPVDPTAGLTQADIDAALAGASDLADAPESDAEGPATQQEPPLTDDRQDSTGKPFDEIAAAMAAEIEEAANKSPEPAGSPPPGLAGAEPLELDSLDETQAEAQTMIQGIGLLSDVELQVKIELGRATKTVEEVLALGSGSVVELDRLAGDPVDILVNDRLVARGEVLVLNDNLCIRVSEIASRETGAETA